MFLTCDNGLVSAIFLRNLRVQNTKRVRPLRSLYDTIDQCGFDCKLNASHVDLHGSSFVSSIIYKSAFMDL